MKSKIFISLTAVFCSLSCIQANTDFFVGSCSDTKEKICLENYFEGANKSTLMRYKKIAKKHCAAKKEVFSDSKCPDKNKKFGCSTSGKMKDISWYYTDDKASLIGLRIGCKSYKDFKLIEIKK